MKGLDSCLEESMRLVMKSEPRVLNCEVYWWKSASVFVMAMKPSS